MTVRVAVIIGTRPEVIKMAPVVLAAASRSDVQCHVIATAQHRSMLDQALAVFDIHPEVDLNIISPRQSLTDVTVRVLERMDAVLADLEPDVVAVQGDTTTAFAAGLAAFYRQVPVAHVEAGLRTHDRWNPYPEEMNRRLLGAATTLHLAPTPRARLNLEAEGVAATEIVVTGNTSIDAITWAVDRRFPYGETALEHLDADPRRVLLVTAHRRESWGEGIAAIGRAVARLAARDDLLVVLPVHLNPKVREDLLPPLAGLDNVILTEPLAYGPFARLLARATVVLTDSGGIQEEAPSLGKPVLVMRDVTERPEAVAAGAAALVGTDADAIVAGVSRLLDDAGLYSRMANAVNPYGDGHAAPRVLDALAHAFGSGPPADEFVPSVAQPPDSSAS